MQDEVCDKLGPQEDVALSEMTTEDIVASPSCSARSEGEGEPVSSTTPYRLATVCLGLLCALLLAALTALCVYYSINVSRSTMMETKLNELTERHNYLRKNTSYMKSLNGHLMIANEELKAHNINLTADKHIFQDHYMNESATRQQLELENEELVQEMAQLNRTLNSILAMNTFPVNQYCNFTIDNERRCTPCQKGWVQYRSSCYFFMEDGKGDWEDSRRDCYARGGDLIIIDNKGEQEFINSHIIYLYDKYHKYWIGLKDPAENGSWIWADGSKLNEGYWMSRPKNNYDNCVYFVIGHEPLRTWLTANCYIRFRWICESHTVMWPDQLMNQLTREALNP